MLRVSCTRIPPDPVNHPSPERLVIPKVEFVMKKFVFSKMPIKPLLALQYPKLKYDLWAKDLYFGTDKEDEEDSSSSSSTWQTISYGNKS